MRDVMYINNAIYYIIVNTVDLECDHNCIC